MSADDAAPAPAPAFMSALVTEHFALQSLSSATISESGSRAALYLSSLSSGLVAIGFASSSHRSLSLLAFSVLPTVFVLGWFTTVRLIETSVENLVCRRRIQAIRGYYAELDPRRSGYFVDAASAGAHGVRYGGRSVLFTMASMIHLVNSLVGGAVAALICILGLGLSIGSGIAVGAPIAAALLAAGLAYEYRRLAPLIRSDGHSTDDRLT